MMNELKSLIREYVLLERLRSKQFNLRDFKSLHKQVHCINYAMNTLKELGEGSSRKTFILSSNYVLKVAYTRDLSQNKAEVDAYTHPQTRDVFAKIYDFDENYYWLISEIVRPLQSEDEFYKLTGLKLEDSYKPFVMISQKTKVPGIITIIKDFIHDDEQLPSSFTEQQKQFVISLINVFKTMRLDYGELRYIGHWGKTKDGRVVILDYGISDLM